METPNDKPVDATEALIRVEVAVKQLEQAMNPPLIRRFLFGVITGFGTVVGATVVVALVVWIAQPLRGIGGLGPAIDRLVQALERSPK